MQIGCYSVLVILAKKFVKITRGLLEMRMKAPETKHITYIIM